MARKKELVIEFGDALEHLRDDQAPLSPAALAALTGAHKSDLAAFAQTWTALPADRRRRAAQMLVDLAEEDFKNDFNVLFRYLLNDEDAEVRAHAIDGLWEDEDPGLVKPLIGFLRSDPDARVRAAAGDSLGRFVLLAEYGRLPQETLVKLTRDALLATIQSGTEETLVRARAMESLAYWSDDSMRQIIAAAYESPEPQMRVSALAAMGRSADTYWRETTAAELDSPDPEMRFEAARASGELENRAAVGRLIDLLEDTDREVQGAAITALGQIGGKPAREALTRAADSDDEVLRGLADEALQELDFVSNSDLLLFNWEQDDDDFTEEDLDEEEEEWDDDENGDLDEDENGDLDGDEYENGEEDAGAETDAEE